MVLSLWLLVMSDGVVVVVGWCCLVVLSGGVVWNLSGSIITHVSNRILFFL
jgi:hypothetical protein